jgi:hypothetical protein
MSNTKRLISVTAFLVSTICLITASYSAYKGHADDSDINAILAAYPQLKGTAADSCATCHKAGQVAESSGPFRNENHCGYCHAIHVKNKIDAAKTLNSYGADYFAVGRGIKAINAIAQKDSDGDGFLNDVELLKGTNPGVHGSNPSAPIAPSRIYTAAELRSLSPAVHETVFLNTAHNKLGDSYNEYRGNNVNELLQAVGISNNVESIDFISLDGFENSFTLSELNKEWPQGAPVMRLDKKIIGQCGWVNYNTGSLDEKKPLHSAKILLAFEENGKKIEPGKIDPETGRIRGTGPLRLVVPQFQISPPDIPKFDESCRNKIAKEYQFNENYDHNGGRSSFSIIVIRINPLPKGTRDFDWQKIRDELAKDERIVFFGALSKK